MNKYKKKDCYNYMPSLTDEASDSDGAAKKVRTTGSPSILSDLTKTEVRISCRQGHMYVNGFVH